MPGPIVRSYGIPGWDDIFGKGSKTDDGSKSKKGSKVNAAKAKKSAQKVKAATKKVAVSKAKKNKAR